MFQQSHFCKNRAFHVINKQKEIAIHDRPGEKNQNTYG